MSHRLGVAGLEQDRRTSKSWGDSKDLVDRGLVLGTVQGGLEILNAKVAYTDAIQLPFVLECLKGFTEDFQFA